MRPPGWMMVLAAVGCGGATRAPTPVEAPPAPASPTAVAPARSPVPALGAELNLGFEELDGDLPRGWTPRAAGPGGAADATPRGGADTVAHSGDHSLRVIGTGDGAAMAGASLDATALRGKRVRLHGWVRTDGVGPPGWAGLWLRVDGGAGGLDNMSDRGLVGTSDWREAIASLEVPAGAERLVFGPLLVGAGTAWFDDLALEVVEVVEAAPPHPIEVGGVVVDGHGAVVPGAQVAVIQANQLVALVAGDRAGRFHATVTSGTLSVSALAPGRVGGFIEEARYDGDRRDLRVILPDGGGVEVRGRLVASAPVPAGEPVLVWPVSEHSGDMFALPAAADGTFAAVLPRGDQYGALVLGERVQGTGSAARVGDAVTLEVPVTVLAPAPPEVAAWLGRAGAPLTTVEAGHGFADLAPIGRMVGTARVVGLGEATHGSREFFQLKHRLLEYLVAEHGFTVFAIEANQPECRAINAYVLHGTGDARAALAGIYFWTWDTEEVLAMIEWMRAWNADPAHRRKVQFVGFDMQVPRVAEAAVAAFVRQVAPAEADALLAPLGDPRARAAGLAALTARFTARTKAWRRAGGAAAFADAQHDLRILAQADAMRTARDGRASADVRDQAMAENIGWLLAQAPRGARMVVWAHNGHVETSGTFGMVPMGAHLRRALGADYLALGLVFDQGEFQAIDRTDGATGMDLRAFTVGPAPDTDVAAPFAATGHPLLAVDLRTAPAGVVADWLAAPHRMREVGSMYFGAAAVGPPPALAGRFDALIFVARTTRARSLPR